MAHDVRRGLALDDAKELLENALAGPAGEDDFSVLPLRNIIAVLETPCSPTCDVCNHPANRPATARCPDMTWDGMVGFSHSTQCDTRCSSEQSMYDHLRWAHRYPEEDAGSSAQRAWEERTEPV